MANSLTIGTINICGLKDKTKRNAVFSWLDNFGYDAYFLQETHCHLRKDEKLWSSEWGAQCYWSRGTSKSRGVAILFNRKKVYDIENITVDSDGRYLYCDVVINDNRYRIINIYAPNN